MTPFPYALVVAILAASSVSALDALSYGPALCGSILEETYGALQGWTPEENELQQLCGSIVQSKLAKNVKSPGDVDAVCAKFVTQVKPFYRQKSETSKPLKEVEASWCNDDVTAASSKQEENYFAVMVDNALGHTTAHAASSPLEKMSKAKGAVSTRALLKQMEKQEVMQAVTPTVGEMWEARADALETETAGGKQGASENSKAEAEREADIEAEKALENGGGEESDEVSLKEEKKKHKKAHKLPEKDADLVSNILVDADEVSGRKRMKQTPMKKGGFRLMDEHLEGTRELDSTESKKFGGKKKFMRKLSSDDSNSDYLGTESDGEDGGEGLRADDPDAIRLNKPPKDSERIEVKGLVSMTKKFFKQAIEFLTS